MKAAAARGLHPAAQPEVREEVAHEHRGVAHFAERDLRRIQIEEQLIGAIERVDGAAPWMMRDAAEIDEVDHRRAVATHDMIGIPEGGVLGADATRRDPRRQSRRRALLVHAVAARPVGPAQEAERALREIRQHVVGHREVVVDQVALGESRLGPQLVIEPRQHQATAVDVEQPRAHAACRCLGRSAMNRFTVDTVAATVSPA